MATKRMLATLFWIQWQHLFGIIGHFDWNTQVHIPAQLCQQSSVLLPHEPKKCCQGYK